MLRPSGVWGAELQRSPGSQSALAGLSRAGVQPASNRPLGRFDIEPVQGCGCPKPLKATGVRPRGGRSLSGVEAEYSYRARGAEFRRWRMSQVRSTGGIRGARRNYDQTRR